MRRLSFFILASMLLASPAWADDEAELAWGKALVELNCAQCHAVGAADESPHEDAPPLRDLSRRYPLDALEEAFVEGIYVGHPDMPEFTATPEQIAAIISWIASIEPE